jgi:hypothetical protein
LQSPIVLVKPFDSFGMVRVVKIGDDGQRFMEAGNTAAILGRGVPFAADIARMSDTRFALSNAGDGGQVFPAVAEIVEIVDGGLARL